MIDDQLFADERRTGIGGYDAPAVLGISPWRTPFDVWLEKSGKGVPTSENELMYWGKRLEPLILDEYARRTGRILDVVPMLRHPSYHWMIAHLDSLVAGQRRIVEAKTARSSLGWGEPGSDEIPLHYLAQVHHYLVVAEAEIADVAVLIGGNDFRLYEIHADEDIKGRLVDAEHAFWQCVQEYIPPDPVNTQDAVRRWGRLTNAGTVVASQADIETITLLHEIRERQRELEAGEEAGKLAIMQSLGDRGDTLVDLAGTPLASWKLDRGRKAYTVNAREPGRRFLLKGDNDG